MNADAFRHFYAYHFAENRKIWDAYIAALSPEQFTRAAEYAHGSVRNQVVHLMEVEDVWFSELAGIQPCAQLPPTDMDDRGSLRAQWDLIEQRMQSYLGDLRDEMLFHKPITDPQEDKDLLVWQVLLHVVNHGTDHRAQLLRTLHDLGCKTGSQDYIFYVYDHPQ